MATIIIAIGFITLLEYILKVDLKIDQLIIKANAVELMTSYPGRIAPSSAVAFVFTGISLLLLSNQRRGSHWFAALGMALSWSVILGYIFGPNSLYAFVTYVTMAIHTAVSFLLMNLAILLARPKQGFVGILSSFSMGGDISRRLVTSIPPGLIGIGLVCLYGSKRGWYDDNLKFTLMILFGTLFSMALIIWVASDLNKMDMQRTLAEAELLKLNLELEARVYERTLALQLSLDNIKHLEGMIPICAWCKNVRDDKKYWKSVEVYIADRTDVKFSHGICPDCRLKIEKDNPVE